MCHARPIQTGGGGKGVSGRGGTEIVWAWGDRDCLGVGGEGLSFLIGIGFYPGKNCRRGPLDVLDVPRE